MAAHAWTKSSKKNNTLIQTSVSSYIYECKVQGCDLEQRFAQSSQYTYEDVFCNGVDMGVLIGTSWGVAEIRHLEMLSQYFIDSYQIPASNMSDADFNELSALNYVGLSPDDSEVWLLDNGKELIEA